MPFVPLGTIAHTDGTVLGDEETGMDPITVDDVSDGDLDEYSGTGTGVSVTTALSKTGGHDIEFPSTRTNMGVPCARRRGCAPTPNSAPYR